MSSVWHEVEAEVKNTQRILDRIEDQHLGWRPHEKSMTVGELAGHVVELHNWLAAALQVEKFDLATMYQRFNPTSVAEIKSALVDGMAKNKEVVESLSPAEWGATWTMTMGDYVIASLPKAAAFRFIIQNHLIHHRGQLSVYLRMLDIPVPGLYGPSADDK